MASKVYYWVDESSVFGGGKNAVKFGEEMPKSVSDERLAQLKKLGQVSTERKVTERQLSELERLRAKVAELGSGSGITQADLDAAKSESVQADLDKIAELEAQLEEATKPKAGRPPKGA